VGEDDDACLQGFRLDELQPPVRFADEQRSRVDAMSLRMTVL
jgi:hypothetical protein